MLEKSQNIPVWNHRKQIILKSVKIKFKAISSYFTVDELTGKPWVCKVCDRAFALKGNLQQHEAIHSDKRPYKCDVCDFSTKFQSHLTLHKRTHTGKKLSCLSN